MGKNDGKRILAALADLMRPVSRFLLQAGISYRDFEEVSKKAFVDSAIENYGIRGRPTNISRVALLTGLTRKEVRLLKELGSNAPEQGKVARSLPAEVLHRWHTAEAYIDDSSGLPLDLPFSGEEASFESLVRECMRDIPPGAVRAELKRTGAISEGANGILRVLTREFVPLDAETKLVEGLEAGLVPLARTIGFNADPERSTLSRFQRVVTIPFIRKGMVRQLETELNDKLRVITRELDDYLTEFEVTENDPDRCEGLGVGIYYFREVE